MRKFLAVVKREYFKVVWSRTFIIGTLLAPLMAVGFAVVPALLLSIEGDALRIAIVDQSAQQQVGADLQSELSPETQRAKQVDKAVKAAKNSVKDIGQPQEDRIRQSAEQMKARFAVETVSTEGRAINQIKSELNARLRDNKLDAYIVIPTDFETRDIEFYARNTSDFVGQSRVEDAVNEAARRVRMRQADISPDKLNTINRPINLRTINISERGEKEDAGDSFFLVFAVGFLIYLTLTIYGSQILSAVVEEKETRIAEILFSSARPFTLMMGKLVGVGLGAFTQLAIWILSGAVLLGYLALQSSAAGFSFPIPSVSPLFVIGLLIFFLLGFFTYATIYALIGSMVTTTQEGGQLSLIPTFVMLAAFYCFFPVMRNPNSALSTWLSLAPFVSPIVMPVRMAIITPPAWQIAASIALNLLAIVAVTWTAARAYRIGMLMYGKKATIPEVWRWIRQA